MEQIEIDIEELAKAKKRVWVKPTAQKKGHYREMEVGEKEEEKEFSDVARKVIVSGAKKRMSGYMKDSANAKKHLEDLDKWKDSDEYISMTDSKEIYRVQKETWTNELNSANRSIRESQILIAKYR